MDIWGAKRIRGGVCYPADPVEYEARIKYQAIRMLQDQVRDATWRLMEPTREAVEAVARYHVISVQSVCSKALTIMMDFAVYDTMAQDIRMEEAQHEGQVQMSLGPEWDPGMNGEEPEMFEEDPDMDLDEPEEQALVLGGFEGALADGEISDDKGPQYPPMSPTQYYPLSPVYYPPSLSPIHWTPLSD